MTQQQIAELIEALEANHATFGMRVIEMEDSLVLREAGDEKAYMVIPEYVLAAVFEAVLSLRFPVTWGVSSNNNIPIIKFQ